MDASNLVEDTHPENEIGEKEQEVDKEVIDINDEKDGDGGDTGKDKEEGDNGKDGQDEDKQEDKGVVDRKKRKRCSKAYADFIKVTGDDGNMKDWMFVGGRRTFPSDVELHLVYKLGGRLEDCKIGYNDVVSKVTF